MKRARVREMMNGVLENGSYKLVALFVTLILWVTILGRRDFASTKEMDIEFLLPRSLAVAESNQSRRVRVTVSGPRQALKKFASNPGTITIDLGRQVEPGPVKAVITSRNVEVPFGVKVTSVVPDVINLRLIPARSGGAPVGSQRLEGGSSDSSASDSKDD